MEIFFRYIEFEKRLSEHTITSYKNDLTQFGEYLESNYSIKMEEASHSIIRSWIMQLAEIGMTPRTITRKIACLRSFFKFLVKESIIEKDPTQNLKSPKIKKRLPVIISEEECYQLLETLPFTEDFFGIRDKLVLELLYGTGIRLSELIGLNEKDVSTYEGTIKVFGKGKKYRIIPLNKNLVDLIKVYISKKGEEMSGNLNNHLVVTNAGEKAYPIFIYRTVKKYLSLVSTSDRKSPHVLRHSFATHLLNKGAELNAIKDLLGHSSLAATQVYTHNSPEKLRAIFEQAHPKS